MIIINIFCVLLSLWAASNLCKRGTWPWYLNIGAAALNAGIVVAHFLR